MANKILTVALALCFSSMYSAEEAIAHLAITQGHVGERTIYQLPVFDQSTLISGLSTTNCGAHTVRNGQLIAWSLTQPNKCEALEEELHSVQDMLQKFGPGGDWTRDDGRPLSWLDSDDMEHLLDRVSAQYKCKLATYGCEMLARRSLMQSDADARQGMEGAICLPESLKEFYTHYRKQDQFVGVIGIYLQDYREDVFSRLLTAIYATLYDWKVLLYGGKDAYEQYVYSRTYGHWITLVVAKTGDDIFFVTTDSLGNAIRIDNEKIHEVVQLLESLDLEKTYRDRYFRQATALSQHLQDRSDRSKKLLVATIFVAIGYYWLFKENSTAVHAQEVAQSNDAEELLPCQVKDS